MNIRLSELRFEPKFYPRKEPSGLHVSQLCDALERGDILPPMIVWSGAGGNVIIDGVHRWKALSKIYGADREVEVEERAYESEAQAFLDSISLNTAHGLGLSTFDKARTLLRAVELGISREDIAGAFRQSLGKVEKISFSRTAFSKMNEHTHPVALKGSLKPLRQQVLTKNQEKANDYCGGLSAAYYISAVKRLIEADVLTWGSDAARADLRELHRILTEKFAS